MSNDLRAQYETLWSGGWETSHGDPGPSYMTRRRLFIRCVKRVYRPGVRILDVGCGNGSLLRDICDRFPSVGEACGVDISETALSPARRLVPEAAFARCDVAEERLPFDQGFDLVTCCEMLEHVPDWRAVLVGMARALWPGGAAVISVPHSMAHWSPNDEAIHHLRRFQKAELCRAIEESGLRVARALVWGSVVYNLYGSLLLSKVKPETTMKPKGPLRKFVTRVLYSCFFADDLFTDLGNGWMLFAIARKPK